LRKEIFVFILLAVVFTFIANAQELASNMNNNKLSKLIKKINPKIKGRHGEWYFRIKNREFIILTDERADRMRIMSPIVDTSALDKERLYRLLQANFDSAHDSRYAIAKGKLWSAYVHPLSTLSAKQFYSGLNQVNALANSFGKSYSSGLFIFRHGDSARKLRNQKTKK